MIDTIVIIFVVLLLLLIVISAIGGSIRHITPPHLSPSPYAAPLLRRTTPHVHHSPSPLLSSTDEDIENFIEDAEKQLDPPRAHKHHHEEEEKEKEEQKAAPREKKQEQEQEPPAAHDTMEDKFETFAEAPPAGDLALLDGEGHQDENFELREENENDAVVFDEMNDLDPQSKHVVEEPFVNDTESIPKAFDAEKNSMFASLT